MKKGNNYTFTQIEEFASDKVYDIANLSHNDTDVIGESFIILRKDDNDITISFILVGYEKDGYIYECIYSDL